MGHPVAFQRSRLELSSPQACPRAHPPAPPRSKGPDTECLSAVCLLDCLTSAPGLNEFPQSLCISEERWYERVFALRLSLWARLWLRVPFSLALQVSLNDSHNQMVVHWAGEKSNVIVALARDSLSLLGPKNSDVSNATWRCPGVPSLLLCQARCRRLLSYSLPFSRVLGR